VYKLYVEDLCVFRVLTTYVAASTVAYEISRQQGIEEFSKAMRTFRNDAPVQRSGCQAFAQLASAGTQHHLQALLF
jgi:hypothetical protein